MNACRRETCFACANEFGPTLARRASASAAERPFSISTPWLGEGLVGRERVPRGRRSRAPRRPPRTGRRRGHASPPSRFCAALSCAAFFAARSASFGSAVAPLGASASSAIFWACRSAWTSGGHLREARVDLDQGVGDDRGRGDAGEGLVVRRDDVPRRPVRAGVGEDVG